MVVLASHREVLKALPEQKSTPLYVLLKADPRLEGDASDGKADPSMCHQLGQVSVLQYF